MSILKELFGLNKAEVWRQLAGEIQGRFNSGGFWGTDCVQAQAGDSIITLDTYTVSTGKSSTTFTRIRAPFVNRSGFRFVIYRSGWFSELGKWLFGMQDVEVGEPIFDETFVIQGTSPERLRQLFANGEIRLRIHSLPAIHLSVVHHENWWFGTAYPPGVDELTFQVHGILTDLGQLRNLFELFAETLDELREMDAAGKDEATQLLEALAGPGGQVKPAGVVLWDGNPARRRAAEELGRRRVASAVYPLAQVLTDADPVLRVKAARSLGWIGDRSAVSRLIVLLGDFEPAGSEPVRIAAIEALRKLGADDAVQAFARVLAGDRNDVEALRDQWIAASHGLVRALQTADPLTVARAASGLAELSAVDALPEVRKARRKLRGADPAIREELDRAIEELERRSDLPRPAAAPEPDAAALPRPADAPQAEAGKLPIPVSGSKQG